MANIVLDFLHNYQTGERRESEPANAYQYDEGHVLEAVLPEVITSAEIHYWIRGMEEADAYTPTSITPNSDGSCKVLGNIPNTYFETNGELRIYIVVTDGTASITTYEGKLHICQRSMPDDYVDDDPENEATRILTEAQAAAATATAAAQTAQDVADSIPADYSQLSEDVSTLKEDISHIGGLSEDVKQALLACFRNVVWDDTDGNDYIQDLYDAMYPPADLVSISAVYTQSGTVYDTDTLDSLKSDLVVTAHMSDSSTRTVTDYVLSGTLTDGTSTITVTYSGKTTTFSVTVTEDDKPSDYTWLYKASDGVLLSARTDIVTPTNTGSTETLNNGNLNLFVPHVVSGISKNIRYDLVDTTTTSGKLSAKIRFNELDVSSTAKAYGFRLQLSNGTNGIMFYEWYNGTTLKLLTYVNNTLTQLVSLDFDTWYIIEIEINNGTYTIKVNGNSVHTSTTPATYYCTANRIQIQNSGGTTASATDNDVDVEWIAYKAND